MSRWILVSLKFSKYFSSILLKGAWSLSDYLHHGVIELRTTDLVVLIPVHFLHDLIPNSLVVLLDEWLADSTMEHSPEFINADLTVSILVK